MLQHPPMKALDDQAKLELGRRNRGASWWWSAAGVTGGWVRAGAGGAGVGRGWGRVRVWDRDRLGTGVRWRRGLATSEGELHHRARAPGRRRPAVDFRAPAAGRRGAPEGRAPGPASDSSAARRGGRPSPGRVLASGRRREQGAARQCREWLTTRVGRGLLELVREGRRVVPGVGGGA